MRSVLLRIKQLPVTSIYRHIRNVACRRCANAKIYTSAANATMADETHGDHYATLGVNAGSASSEDIKKAYRNLALECHPDKAELANDGGHQRPERFLKVQESYRVLSDAQSRKEYDASHRDAALRQTSVVNEVITVDDMTFDSDDLTYHMCCRCGGKYVIDHEDVCLQTEFLIPCDTCSLSVKLCSNTFAEAERVPKEEKPS